jgi:hypothetical protein
LRKCHESGQEGDAGTIRLVCEARTIGGDAPGSGIDKDALRSVRMSQRVKGRNRNRRKENKYTFVLEVVPIRTQSAHYL